VSEKVTKHTWCIKRVSKSNQGIGVRSKKGLINANITPFMPGLGRLIKKPCPDPVNVSMIA
jgi:hypothetical protein